MQDQITLERIKALHPKLREEALEIYNQICIALTGKAICRFSFTLRSFKDQEALYAQGRTIPGKIVTQAKAGLSYHNYGLAIDLVEIVNNQANWNFDYSKLVPFANKYGLFWGGNFKSIKDKPHFQKEFGYTYKQLLDKYKKGDLIPGTIYVNIS